MAETSVSLDMDQVDSFPMEGHSADQETATDQPVGTPESGVADPTATGKF